MKNKESNDKRWESNVRIIDSECIAGPKRFLSLADHLQLLSIHLLDLSGIRDLYMYGGSASASGKENTDRKHIENMSTYGLNHLGLSFILLLLLLLLQTPPSQFHLLSPDRFNNLILLRPYGQKSLFPQLLCLPGVHLVLQKHRRVSTEHDDESERE